MKVSSNIDKSLKAMRRRELSLARRTLSQALRKGGKVVLEATKGSVPVRSGLLKKSMKLRVAKSKKPYVRFRVTNAETAYWGLWVEQGSKRQRAQHEMKRAAERTKSAVVQLVQLQLRQDMR